MSPQNKSVDPDVITQVKALIKARASIRQVERAVKLVEQQKAFWIDESTVCVESQSNEGTFYYIEKGDKWCDCIWMARFPERVCTHRIAALLLYYQKHPAVAPESIPHPPGVVVEKEPVHG